MDELSDDELNAWILARLQHIGVDVTVLPDEDSEAPADQQRILASARRFLRSTVPAISNLDLTPNAQGHGAMPFDPFPPGQYPSALSARTGPKDGRRP